MAANKTSLRAISKSLWEYLTRPAASVIDKPSRQQSRLLSSLLLAAMIVILLITLFSTQVSGQLPGAETWLVASMALFGVVTIAYFLTRKGHYRFATLAMSGVVTGIIFSTALTIGGPSSYNSLFYLVAVTLFACAFLSIQVSILIASLQLLMLFLLRSSFPQISPEAILSGPFSANLFVSVFVLVLTYHQQRAVFESREELKASEERYRVISELISDYAYSLRVAPDGSILHEWITEDSFIRTTGYTHTELDHDDKVNLSLFYPEDEAMLQQELQRVLQNQPTKVEHRIRTKNGQTRWVQIFRQPVWDEIEKRVTRFYGVTQDITARKQAELALIRSEERYRLLTETISDFVMLYDVGSSQIVYISPSYEKAIGYTLPELNRLKNADRVHPDDLETAQTAMRQVLSGKAVEGVQYRSRTKSGQYLWLEVYSNPLKDEHGHVMQIIVSARDITTRKQTEMALKASEERYRVISELISDYAYFFRINPDGSQYREWITDSVTRVTGYAPEEMPQDPEALATIFYPDDIQRALEELKQLKAGNIVNSESRLRTKSGEKRWLSISRHPVWDDLHMRVIGYYGVAKDITERKLAELALRESEARYRKISDLISDYAFYSRINPDGTMEREWITDSFARVTGYQPKEIGANDAPSLFHPDSLDTLENDRQRVMRGESVENDYRIITKQGIVRWLNLIRQPVWDADAQRVTGYYAVARDVTEHKQIEAQKLKLLLEQKQFSIVSHLVEALSHDFRTALATIETSRYLTERLVGDEVRPKVQPKLETIQRSVNHLAAQLENLHMVSFLTVPTLVASDVNQLIAKVIAEYQPRAKQADILLIFTADNRLPRISVDPVKIERAIRHLLVNALTHTPRKGHITVSTSYSGDYSIINIQDSGSGIPREAIQHIFDPFYRGDQARRVDKGGVGLGLTIVKMIVEAHNGFVEVDSSLGEGSLFTLRLPLRADLEMPA